jgi:tripartite-type tricarboxylate transporter receptor subunit TctC
MRIYRLITATLGLLLAAGSVHAQNNYPTKPIRVIVAFPPGGSTDILARMLAQKLSETFKHQVLVDNRPGGGGVIGIETAVRANPDGYTLLIVSAAYAANAALYKLPYDPVNDVAPVALLGETGFVATVHPAGPIKSIRELIAYDKANPGKLNYGSGGTGSSVHLATELFNQMAGTTLTHVPYKGTGAALTELVAGQIHLVIGSMPETIPHIKSSRLRAVAVTTPKRSGSLPDVPAVGETVAGYEAVNWSAVLGPKALPKDIVARWNTEIDRVLQLADVKERMAGIGVEPVGGAPERFREVLRRDVAKWQRVVKIANIRPGS